MNVKSKVQRYTKTVTVRVPEAVYDAVMKRVSNKQKKYPRYSDAEVMRKALVKHLKQKGYLDSKKDYL